METALTLTQPELTCSNQQRVGRFRSQHCEKHEHILHEQKRIKNNPEETIAEKERLKELECV